MTFKLLLIPIAFIFSVSLCIADSSHSKARNTSLAIDQLMEEGYKDLGLTARPFVNETVFLRRAYISIIGRIPTPEETSAFLNDTHANKRHELIDKLIDSPGYNHHMFNMYADMLRLKTNFQSSGVAWHLWLKDAVEKNTPYNKMVNEMLRSDGHISKNPAVAYYLRDPNMLLDNVSNTVQIFLGTQIGCAQCHDDPFEDTTQMEYYQLAAFSGETVYGKPNTARERLKKLNQEYRKSQPQNSQTRSSKKKSRKQGPDPTIRSVTQLFKQFRRSEINTSSGKTIQLPHDYPYNDGEPNQHVSPQTLFGNMPNLHDYDNPKEAFADWVTSPENPMFTKTIVNRLWARVFGYGLAEPLDNWTPSTKPSHPATLTLLEKVMKTTNFDIKETMRVMYHTALFQRQVVTKEVEMGKRHNFTGPVLRRLSAEQIHDSYLTIEHGNLDEVKNPKMAEDWNEHLEHIQFLLEAPLQEISLMAEEYKAYEEQRYAKQSEQIKLRLNQEKAQASGNTTQMKKAQKEMQEFTKERRTLATKGKYTKIAVSLTRPTIRANVTRIPIRSSEMPSPHKASSIMPQFGSSDRETPDAGHTRANIPQVLSIFNGQAIERIADRKGRLAQTIKEASSPQERLDSIFLSIYASYPSDSEREELLPMMNEPTDIATVVRAMLTSKRFLFLQ